MTIKEKLNNIKQKMEERVHRGLEQTLQERDEKQRIKTKKVKEMKPGVKQTLLMGVMNKSSPLDVMKQEYNRRKYEREKKYNSK